MANAGLAKDWRELFIDEIRNTMRSISDIAADDHMPSARTIYAELASNTALLQHYARAREERADLMFAEVISIADQPETDSTSVQRDRLRIDARKWALARMAPKKYGDRVQVETETNEKMLTHEEQVKKIAEVLPIISVLLRDPAINPLMNKLGWEYVKELEHRP